MENSLSQNHLLIKTFFTFADTCLHYRYKSTDKDVSFQVDYTQIPITPTQEIADKYSLFRNLGIAALMIGGAMAVNNFMTLGRLEDTLFLHLGLISMFLYSISTKKFSVFATGSGNILVLKDKKHDTIIEKMHHQRNRILKELYAHIDFQNSKEHEIEKFDHLLKDGIITEEEYNQFLIQLETKSKQTIQ